MTDTGYVGADRFQYAAADLVGESRPAVVMIDVQQSMDVRVAPAARAVVAEPGQEPGRKEEIFVRFDLSGLRRNAFRARLRVVTDAARTVYAVTDDRWVPAGMTWATRPKRGTKALARWPASPTKRAVEFDITPLVRSSLAAGDRKISLALAGFVRPAKGGAGEGESDGLQLILTTSNVITVDSPFDNDDASQNQFAGTTLREAIQIANSTTDPEVIAFDLDDPHPVIELDPQRGELVVSSDMYILGPADGSTLTISVPAGADMRAFSIAQGALVGISDLLVTGGNVAAGDGGAIYNAGDLTLERVTVGGSSAGGRGGAVFNAATGTLTLRNATLSGNSTGMEGRAVYNAGTLTVTHATITANTAGTAGAGIKNAGTATVKSTIIAANAPDDVSGALTSAGYNLAGNADGSSGFGAAGDGTGTAASPIDAMPDVLSYDGGASRTPVRSSAFRRNGVAAQRATVRGLWAQDPTAAASAAAAGCAIPPRRHARAPWATVCGARPAA